MDVYWRLKMVYHSLVSAIFRRHLTEHGCAVSLMKKFFCVQLIGYLGSLFLASSLVAQTENTPSPLKNVLKSLGSSEVSDIHSFGSASNSVKSVSSFDAALGVLNRQIRIGRANIKRYKDELRRQTLSQTQTDEAYQSNASLKQGALKTFENYLDSQQEQLDRGRTMREKCLPAALVKDLQQERTCEKLVRSMSDGAAEIQQADHRLTLTMQTPVQRSVKRESYRDPWNRKTMSD
jgi:hypothetical protein